MSSILQAQQLYTMGTPLLEAYLLPMANNRTCNERLSAASHMVTGVQRFIGIAQHGVRLHTYTIQTQHAGKNMQT